MPKLVLTSGKKSDLGRSIYSHSDSDDRELAKPGSRRGLEGVTGQAVILNPACKVAFEIYASRWVRGRRPEIRLCWTEGGVRIPV